jgi:elongation factor Ts
VLVGSYIHSGNKIATLVALSAIEGAEEARNIYASCSNVSYRFNEAGVDAATIEKKLKSLKTCVKKNRSNVRQYR